MYKQAMLATALGGFCLAAAADSGVTIYGVMDINMTTISGGGKGFTGIEPGGISGSRLGFRGAEDLGGGLKAIYRLEFGSLRIDREANNINSTRESWVGLKGDWGTLIGGRVYSPADDFNIDFSGFSNSALLEPRSNMLNDGGFSTKVDDTFDNGLAYISPSFGGVTLRGAFSLGEQTESPRERKYALAAEYANGPLQSRLIHHYVDNIGGVSPRVDQNETAFGLRYDFPAVQLMGTFVSSKLDDADRDKMWSLGARIPAGPGMVRLSYARLDQSDDNGDADAWGWAAGYYYDLSKRTTLYGGVHLLNNSSRAAYSHERLTGLSAGDDARLAAIGMRHKF